MKKKIAIPLIFFTILFIVIVHPVQAGYQCRSAFSCENSVSDDNCGGSCPAGQVCCHMTGGYRNWSEIIWGSSEPPEEFRILGVELATSDLKSLVKTIIIVATSLLGVVLVGIIFYGGFLWITAGDSEEKLQKAKKVMKSGIIGLLVFVGFLALLGLMAAVFGVNITNFEFLDEILG